MKLFIDCSKGVAGDMLSAALLDLFDDKQSIIEELNGIGIPGTRYSYEESESYGQRGIHMHVRYMDMEENQGIQNPEMADDVLEDSALKIADMIESFRMPEKSKNNTRKLFGKLLETESRVHGKPMSEIHFHVLGTMDAVADISAVSYLIDRLGVDEVVSTPVCTGFGKLQCARRILDIPAPATREFIKQIPHFQGKLEGEMCTPTGAALINYFSDTYAEAGTISEVKTGCGIGMKDFGQFSGVLVHIG